MRTSAAALTATAMLICAPGASAATVTSTPALVPGFGTGDTEHVVRCTGAPTVSLQVRGAAGETVSVNGARARRGAFGVTVPLTAGRRFDIVVTRRGRTRTDHVRCLPAGFPEWTAKRTRRPRTAFFVGSTSLVTGDAPRIMIFDAYGTPVWWKGGLALNPSVHGRNLIWGVPDIAALFGASTTYEEHRLDGTLVHRWDPVGRRADGIMGDAHEFRPLPDGKALLHVLRPVRHVDLSALARLDPAAADATVADGEIQEVSPKGRLLWSWRALAHIAPAETDNWFGNLQVVMGSAEDAQYDLFHINAFDLDNSGGIVISNRHDNAIYRVQRSTGRITWKLGGTTTSKSLRILRDPYAATAFGGQHTVRVLPDGTITMFDNGTLRDRPARALRFRIDTRARTATLIESATDPAAAPSPFAGGATRVAPGTWVVSYGGTPRMEEMDDAGRPSLVITFTDPRAFSYRLEPVMPGEPITIDRLRAGMDRMAR